MAGSSSTIAIRRIQGSGIRNRGSEAAATIAQVAKIGRDCKFTATGLPHFIRAPPLFALTQALLPERNGSHRGRVAGGRLRRAHGPNRRQQFERSQGGSMMNDRVDGTVVLRREWRELVRILIDALVAGV